jgi:hypothetical protein
LFTVTNQTGQNVGPLGFATQVVVAPSAAYVVADALYDDFLYDQDLLVAVQSAALSVTVGNKTLSTPLAASYLDALRVSRPQPRDTDGSFLTRDKHTQTGWHFNPRAISWECGQAKSLHNADIHGADLGDATINFLDVSGNPIVQGILTDLAFQILLTGTCVATYVDWWPQVTVDLYGARLMVKGVTAAPAYGYVVVAPDIPSYLGGSVPFGSGGFDLSFIYDSGTQKNTGQFEFDGQGVKTLTFDPTYRSNKLRIQVNHPLGYAAGLHIIFQEYTA